MLRTYAHAGTKRKASSDSDQQAQILSKRPLTISFSPSRKYLLDAFQSGDLIFGMFSSITKFTDELAKRKYSYIYANHLNSNVIRMVVEKQVDLSSLQPHERQHYYYLWGHRNYLMRPNGKPVPNEKDRPVIGSAFRRACKLLVGSASISRRVHFELSGLDIKKVCEKEPKDGVTNSELRALYRQTKKTGNNPYLFFYKDGKPCSPPWEMSENKTYFEKYDRQRALKKK